MLRTPLQSRERLPSCFGFGLESIARGRCQTCAVRARCVAESATWHAATTLADLYRNALAHVAIPTLDRASLERIYDREYELHFGRRSYRKSTTKNATTFGRLLSFLLQEDVDPATFIAANMLALREVVAGTKWGFQPNMLSGEKAKARYNAFLRKSNRRYRRGFADTAEHRSALGALRTELATEEYEVAELFVRCAHSGTSVTWEEAIDVAKPSPTWLAFWHRTGEPYTQLRRDLGDKAADHERSLAQLTAAVRLADDFEFGLSERIGVTEFAWQAFADLIVRSFPVAPRTRVDLSSVPGSLWRPR